MFNIAIVFFRESLEITMILGIIMAVARMVPRRNFLVAIGLVAAFLCSCVIAYSTKYISGLAQGVWQDVFSLIIIISAIFTLAWTVTWMRQHVGELNSNIKNVTQEVNEGRLPLYTISLVVFSTAIREMIEIILFTFGIISSSELPFAELVKGAVLGIITGLGLGIILYLGLVNIPRKYIFSITTTMLVIVAAGMSAQIPNILESIGIINSYAVPLWDSSHIISESSPSGKVLQVLVGYTAKPTALQLMFYFTTLISISYLSRVQNKKLA